MKRHLFTGLTFVVGAGVGILATLVVQSALATAPSADLCDIVRMRLEDGASLPAWPSLEVCARTYPAEFGYVPPSAPPPEPTSAECREAALRSQAPRSQDPLERLRQRGARSSLADCLRLYPEEFNIEPTR